MKKPILLILFVLLISGLNAQYKLYKEVDGVEFYTKWSHEKWWSKKSSKVLMVKIVNKNDYAVSYSLGIEFFKELRMVEQSKEAEYCLDAKGKAMPRVKGVMVSPAAAESEYDSFELTGLEVEKVEACEPK